MAIDWKYLKCIMTNSTCYKKSYKMKGGPRSVLWHDTGCNNKNIRRYVQPLTSDKDYQKIIDILGKNPNGNDWNHAERQAGVNAFIGVDKDGNVITCQTLPWDMRPWGCGASKYGSENDYAIQFEICQDAKKDKVYAQKCYDEAVKCTAWLCEQYGIDPKGTHKNNGVTVPNILCHYDSWKLGLGSNHDDIYDWFPSLIGKDMIDVRNDVYALMTKKGWVQTADGSWYYYLNNGEKAIGWKKIDKQWYCFANNGVMKSDSFVKEDDGYTYYLKKNGQMAIGWQKIKKDWYYFSRTGKMIVGKWVTSKSQKYYFNEKGIMQTGWIQYNGAWYWSFEDGHMATNEWIQGKNPNTNITGYWWMSKNGKFTYKYRGMWRKTKKGQWWFKDESGWYAKNEKMRIKGVEYEFDKEGYLIEDKRTYIEKAIVKEQESFV